MRLCGCTEILRNDLSVRASCFLYVTIAIALAECVFSAKSGGQSNKHRVTLLLGRTRCGRHQFDMRDLQEVALVPVSICLKRDRIAFCWMRDRPPWCTHTCEVGQRYSSLSGFLKRSDTVVS